MILWMRQYNQQTNGPGVSFFGFDMQYPRLAMDHVEAYVVAVQPDSLAYVRSRYSCFRPYQNNQGDYDTTSGQQQCHLDVQAAYDFLQDNQAHYEAQSSPEAFTMALQHARLVVQAEDSYSSNPMSFRDEYMAENTRWLLDTWLGPDDKIVLWAHNFHVAVSPVSAQTQGTFLRNVYLEEMVVMGFSFYSGTFNAVLRSNGEFQGLQKHSAPPPPEDTFAYQFDSIRTPRFFLNVRDLAPTDFQNRWLRGPRRFRSIGAVYNAADDLDYYYQANLASEFDVIIYFKNTTASFLLPFTSAAAKHSPPRFYP